MKWWNDLNGRAKLLILVIVAIGVAAGVASIGHGDGAGDPHGESACAKLTLIRADVADGTLNTNDDIRPRLEAMDSEARQSTSATLRTASRRTLAAVDEGDDFQTWLDTLDSACSSTP